MNENRNIVDLYIFATLMHIVFIFTKSCTVPMMPAVVAMHYLHDAPTLAAFSSAATPPASTATRHRESAPEHRNQTEPSTLPDKSTIPFFFFLSFNPFSFNCRDIRIPFIHIKTKFLLELISILNHNY